MKKIKIEGKLNLNKRSVSKLNNFQMHDIKGGVAGTTNNILSFTAVCTQEINGCKDRQITAGIFCR